MRPYISISSTQERKKMSVVVLAHPGSSCPDQGAYRSFSTPDGGRLLIWDNRTPFDVINQWHADPNLEVWQRPGTPPNMLAWLSGTVNFPAFKEICTVLAMEGHTLVSARKTDASWTLELAGIDADTRLLTLRLRSLAERLGVDIAIVDIPPSPSLSRAGCLLMDMDSTLIRCECIDEIADFLGIREKISSITRRAMEGELDFTASLRERVKQLRGLRADILQQVYDERIRLNEGAEKLVSTLHDSGWKVGLVSGGFTFFTDLLKDRLGLDFAAGNSLEIKDNRLTGNLLGSVVDANAKREALIRQAKAWNIPMSQTVAMGDGANDLPMLNTAALGVAFHAKPKVREVAPYSISQGGLQRVLDLLQA